MSKYLLIESRDPFESADVPYYYDLAAGLARKGHAVTLFLVQNGVLATRSGAARGAHLGRLAGAGVTVFADDFSLRERGIGERDLARGVKSAPIGLVVERLAASWKVMFL